MVESEVERARVEAQARLAAIIESSDDAIVSKTLEGIIKTWNRGAERIFGWTAEEVIDKPITILIPHDRLDEESQILSRLRRGERVDHFETVRQAKDGQLIDVSVTISPVRNEEGQIIGVSKVARDITQQKRFEKELLEAKEAAESARKLADSAREQAEIASQTKDHFLSVLSHELRTPLTPVLAAAGLLKCDPTLGPEAQTHVEMIRRNVETEARLVDDLLDLTRIARGKVELRPEVVDAHEILRNVLAMFQGDIDAKGLEVTFSLRARRHHVWADAGRFQQILLNLVSNAVKFTPADGSVAVRSSDEGGSIRIDVIDSGIGIESDVLPRLFLPFEQGEQTVTRTFGGLGLGLSIVKSLADLHKASIAAVSEGKDKGATFTLRVQAVSPANLAARSGGDLPCNTDGCAVLLVEDHRDTREVLRKLLESIGCKVVTACNVKEAIAAAEMQRFNVLLSDLGLPDGNGLEVMRVLAGRFGIKGIALSGFGQEEDLRRSSEAGFAAHLTKPINFQQLRETIAKMG